MGAKAPVFRIRGVDEGSTLALSYHAQLRPHQSTKISEHGVLNGSAQADWNQAKVANRMYRPSSTADMRPMH